MTIEIKTHHWIELNQAVGFACGIMEAAVTHTGEKSILDSVTLKKGLEGAVHRLTKAVEEIEKDKKV